MRMRDKLTIRIKRGKKRITTRVPLRRFDRFVFVINEQFTNAPNTTQIASGAGRSSASGSNAAIESPNTDQQVSIGAGGTAENISVIGEYVNRRRKRRGSRRRKKKEAIFIINHQVAKMSTESQEASATQIASGGGKFSTGGTNSAIESAGTKQQDSVGGGTGARGINKFVKKKHRRHRRHYW